MQQLMFAGALRTSENQAPRSEDGLNKCKPSLEAYKADPSTTWTVEDGVLLG